MAIFETQDLHLYYGNFHALKGITLSIDSHSVTALIGPSGCGKSTYLKTLNRMNDLVEGVRIEGKVLLDKLNIYHHTTDVYALRKRVGMVFQKPTPFAQSVFENVAYGLIVNGMNNKKQLEEKVFTALQHAFLWDEVKDKLKRSALGLSGGQQQRLCIARTLATEPEVILMDEPTSALDPIATGKIEELITRLSKEYTIVLVTHNMHQARRVSQKTAVFYLGELDEYASTDQLFAQPKSERTQRYLSGKFG
jgi:phosphate transport system ATP-binding protein